VSTPIWRTDGVRGPYRAASSVAAENAVPPAATVRTAARIASISTPLSRNPAAPRSNAARMSDDRSNDVRTIARQPVRDAASMTRSPSVPARSWMSQSATSGASAPVRETSSMPSSGVLATPTTRIGRASAAAI
jgi:hypothetical protein